jgi:hypothetical protein
VARLVVKKTNTEEIFSFTPLENVELERLKTQYKKSKA